MSSKSPAWYDEEKLRRAYYGIGYSGWVVDLGDGTCRLVNEPLLGEEGPQWGDRVPLLEREGMPMIDATNVIERYVPEHKGE